MSGNPRTDSLGQFSNSTKPKKKKTKKSYFQEESQFCGGQYIKSVKGWKAWGGAVNNSRLDENYFSLLVLDRVYDDFHFVQAAP